MDPILSEDDDLPLIDLGIHVAFGWSSPLIWDFIHYCSANYDSIFYFSLFFSNLDFGDLLENKPPSPIAGTRIILADVTPSTQLKTDGNTTRQIKK